MLGEAIDRLTEANIALWHNEDQRRDRSLSDAERLQAADQVIVWNRKRNEAIDEINALLAAQISGEPPTSQQSSQPGSTAGVLTGSFGDLIDRLAIARVRYHHLKKSGDPQNDPRVARVLDEIQDLQDQINQAFAIAPHLAAKERQRLLGFGKHRTYKDEECYG